MLRPRRSDDRRSWDGQSIGAEGIGMVRSDRLGSTGNNEVIDRGAPDVVIRNRVRRHCLSHSEIPSAASWIPKLPRAE